MKMSCCNLKCPSLQTEVSRYTRYNHSANYIKHLNLSKPPYVKKIYINP